MNYNTYKPKQILPAPEDALQSKDYCFTINPKVTLHYLGAQAVIEQYRLLVQLLTIFPSVYDFRIYIEFSKLGKLHAHGWLAIQKIDAFYAEVVPFLEKRCTIAIKENFDDAEVDKKYKTWKDYCKKAYHIWSPYLEEKGMLAFFTRKDLGDNIWLAQWVPKEPKYPCLTYDDQDEELSETEVADLRKVAKRGRPKMLYK